MTGRHRFLTWHHEVRVSARTRRTVLVNTATDRYLVAPDFSRERFLRACASVAAVERRAQAVRNPKLAGSPAILGLLQSAAEGAGTDEDCFGIIDRVFAAGIDYAMEVRKDPRFGGVSPETNASYRNAALLSMLRFATAMRDAELLAWPMFRNVLCQAEDGRHRFEWQQIEGLLSGDVRALHDRIAAQRRLRKNIAVMVLSDAILSRLGIRSVGDMTEEVLAEELNDGVRRMGATGLSPHFALNDLYGQDGLHDLKFPANRYSKNGKEKITGGLRDLLAGHPHMAGTVGHAERYVETRVPGQRKTAISALKKLLVHVAESGGGDPLPFLKGERSLDGLAAGNSNYFKTWRRFFDHLRETAYAEEIREDGKRVVSPDLSNPLDRMPADPGRESRSESPRAPLPQYLIQELKAMLVEDDFAFGKRFKGDYIEVEAGDGGFERVWVPTKTLYMLMKLALPLRGFQNRVLDSGEADRWRYVVAPEIVERSVRTLEFDKRLMEGRWEANYNELARRAKRGGKPGPKTERRQGFLRRNVGPKGETYLTFFANTNKTQDISKGGSSMGYAMPYANAEGVAYALFQRNWVEKYAPLSRLTKWRDLHERYFRQIGEEKLRRYPDTAFLFRMPRSTVGEPLASHAADDYWAEMMMALEARLEKKGIRTQAGGKIALGLAAEDERRKGKVKYSPIFSMHGIRNAFVTGPLQERVPIEVIMKIVGHGSIVMTAWYAKYSVDHITQLVDGALERVKGDADAASSLKALDALEASKLPDVAVAPDPGAFERFRRSPSASRTVTDIGACPNGCTLCHVGARPLHPEGKINGALPDDRNYAALPRLDCTRCRFFITAPAFLRNLISHFHQVTWSLREKSKHFLAQHAKIDKLRYEADRERRAGRDAAAIQAQLQRAQERRAALEEEVAEISDRWVATFKVIEDCVSLARRRANGGGQGGALLVVNDFSAFASAESLDAEGHDPTEFELADWICQAAEVMETNVLTEVLDSAQKTRMRLLDKLLQAQGMNPVFFDLDEDTARVVGNEVARLLFVGLGRRDANRLADGAATLKQLKLERDGAGAGRVVSLEKRLRAIAAAPSEASAGLPRVPDRSGRAAVRSADEGSRDA